MFKIALSTFLLLSLRTNVVEAAADVSKEMMNFVNMLGPMQKMMTEFYDNSQQMFMKSMTDPKIAVLVGQWEVFAPQFMSMVQQGMKASGEIVKEGMKNVDSSQVRGRWESFVSGLQPMSQGLQKSMASMFAASNPMNMGFPLNPAKMFGKK